ncbi:hypothetical protein AB6813_08945 [bacterium RCC_150]
MRDLCSDLQYPGCFFGPFEGQDFEDFTYDPGVAAYLESLKGMLTDISVHGGVPRLAQPTSLNRSQRPPEAKSPVWTDFQAIRMTRTIDDG